MFPPSMQQDVSKYSNLQSLHAIIFEQTDGSELASLSDRATHASRLLGQAIEPTSEWFGPSLEAQVKRRVRCLEFGVFTDEDLASVVRASDYLKLLYELSPIAASSAPQFGMANAINQTAFEVVKMAVKEVQDSRSARREQFREQIRERRSAEMTAPYLNFHSTLQQAFSRSTGTLEERAADASEKLENSVTVPASEEIFEDSYQGRVHRSLWVLQAQNPSESEIATLFRGASYLATPATNDEPGQDERHPEAVLATIDAISRFIRSRNSGDGQRSSDAQSSQPAT
ncbi:hypothetical protein JCM24511_06934 [Saitozyma sp. JCM 24511]|nr:hypothetical protein JCM24511_06934 [Saitozyma sp. JCM 24511]